VNSFVVGCKADGIWNAIKASCILAGARTLTGALVPLVGTAPTNFNFVSGDYNRKTGLVGDGSTKYLDSGRNNDTDPQDSQHLSIYGALSTTDGAERFAGAGGIAFGATGIARLLQTLVTRSRTSSGNTLSNFSFSTTVPFFAGLSRSQSSQYTAKASTVNTSTIQNTSQAPAADSITIFQNGGTFSSARLSFYSVGESLDLAMLDARVTTLVNAFAAAIP